MFPSQLVFPYPRRSKQVSLLYKIALDLDHFD